MIAEAIKKIVCKEDLTYDEAYQVMTEIMDGETTAVQNAAYLAALSTKSTKAETIPEIAGSAAAMRDHAKQVVHDMDVLEIVGTGGDHAGSINISTTAAFIISAGGVKVAKHGNRAASSKSGAADCLEALGVNISTDPEGSVKLLDEVGMCFLFAQKYHSAMKYVGPVRKEIGIPTVFNILGPLTNPAHANFQLLGVYKPELLVPMAKSLMKLGVKRGMAVYGTDCLDEISVSDATLVVEFADGEFKKYEITPEQFGFTRHDKSELAGGTPAENADAARRILSGEKGAGRDAVLLNAGAALHILKEITMEEGIRLAAEMIDSGAALRTLDKYIKVSNEVKA